jgi:hypothetical protein
LYEAGRNLPGFFSLTLIIKTNAMIVNENKTMPDLKSLQACLAKMIADGFTEDFKAEDDGLRALRTDKIYQPAEVKVVNFFRFEGVSNPDDMSILYVIETNDGVKGTLVDAYGTYASPEVNQFILEVERINKKVTDNKP